jgi:predicted lipoprotein with Yx(FWY)xxD motif
MRVKLLGATIVVATLLAGCGSSKSATSTAGGSATTPTAAANATVRIGKANAIGDVLVDAQGRTLYTFDPENTGKIVCTGDCTMLWPPVTVTGQPVAGNQVTGLATVSRPEGTTQVTFNGHPLYRFASDKAPGEAKGDGYGGGIWHAARAPAATGGTPTTASSGGYRY